MLIVCCTPLQIMIAKAMLEARKISRFRLIYFTWVDNDKHRHYYNEFSSMALDSEYIHMDSCFWNHFRYFRRAFSRMRVEEESSIAFAIIDNFFVQYAIKKYKYKDIVTFDDGTANLTQNSQYYTGYRLSTFRLIIRFILRGKINESWIRRHVLAHYTIYPRQNNVVEHDRLFPVNIFSGFSSELGQGEGAERLQIFLGQPIEDYRNNCLSQDYRNIVRDAQVNEYLPHPRERDFDGISNIVETHMIAEDYIRSKLEEYNSVVVFSLGSTALLNISHPRLKKVVIRYSAIQNKMKDLYLLFNDFECDFWDYENDIRKCDLNLN